MWKASHLGKCGPLGMGYLGYPPIQGPIESLIIQQGSNGEKRGNCKDMRGVPAKAPKYRNSKKI